jgi:hypothetical protein
MGALYLTLIISAYLAGRFFELRRRKVPVTRESLRAQRVPGVRDLLTEYRTNGWSALRHPDTVLLTISYALFVGFFVLGAVLLILDAFR